MKFQNELDSDIGYLYDMARNELNHSRTVEIVGSVNISITSLEELDRKRSYITGKFGKCVSWTGGKAHIATRDMPEWAAKVFEQHREEAPETKRWIKK